MITQTQKKKFNRERRHARIRAVVSGTPERPRLAVTRSNKYIAAQLIDDSTGTTLVSAHGKTLGGSMAEQAQKVGETIATLAKEKKIEKVVFDRGGYLFMGHIKAVADAARNGGLIF